MKGDLSLCEAACLSGYRVHELKEAIREGKLHATWRGRYHVTRAVLQEYEHRL